MSTITQTQNQAVNLQMKPKNSLDNSKKTASIAVKESVEPVLSKMSKQLNENIKPSKNSGISSDNVQDFIPDANLSMMGAQSANITAEFVANLLNKSPYEN